jgi:hypothetical protein
MAASMVARLRGDKPQWELVDGYQARRCLEMALLAHASHISGSRVAPPMIGGRNPFDDWR